MTCSKSRCSKRHKILLRLFAALACGIVLSAGLLLGNVIGAQYSKESVEGLLKILSKRASKTNTSFLWVGTLDKDLLIVGNDKVDELYDVRSITKSIVGVLVERLAVRRLIDLDESVSLTFPEWKHDCRRLITLRHILEHRSGVRRQHDQKEWDSMQRDCIENALSSRLETEPGKRYFYTNLIVDLVPKILEKKTEKTFEEIVNSELKEGIGIQGLAWPRDNLGNYLGSAGLLISPRDLLRLAVMLLKENSISCSDGVCENSGKKKSYPFWSTYTDGKRSSPGMIYTHGWGGQYLVIDRDVGLIALRLRNFKGFRQDRDNFSDFVGSIAQISAQLKLDLQRPM